MGRAPCCDKTKVKRGPWSPEEDDNLKNYVQKYGTGGNWITLPQKAGLKRCGKSCRLRWLNYLRPDIKHGGFTEEEDNVILTLFTSIGSRWSVIASQLPGRTDNDVKNYWNTKLKKKLLAGAITGPKIPNPSSLVPINFGGSNKFALSSMDFSSPNSLALFNQVQANYYGNLGCPVPRTSDTLPHSMDVIQGYHEVSPDLLYESSPDQFPLPGRTEVQENGTPCDGLIPTPSPQEISSLSPSGSLARSYASWSDNGLGGELVIFEELESISSIYDHNHLQSTQQEERVITGITSTEGDHSGLLMDEAYPMANIPDFHAHPRPIR